MYRIKVRREGKWIPVATVADFGEACDIYNSQPVPRILTGPGGDRGILHKQYSDNGFKYNGPNYREAGK